MARKRAFPSHPNNHGSYRLSVGYEIREARRVQRHFFLGTDRRLAQRRFNALCEWWDFTVPNSGAEKTWTPELISQALASVQSEELSPTQQNALTFHEGVKLHIAYMKRKHEAGDIRRRRYHDIVDRLERVTNAVGDFPLASLTTVERIDQYLREPWAARPTLANGTTMGHQRASNLIAETATALRWLSKNGYWTAPTNFDEALQPPRLTPDEQRNASKPPQTFTLDEIKTLVSVAATPTERLLLLSGIFLGWTQIDLATLRKDELAEKEGELYINKLRSKTGIQGFWWVCPELATLIRQRADNTDGDLVCLTSKGNPLVRTSDKGTLHDATAPTWKRLRSRAEKEGVRNLPYKSLRKYAGQMVKNLSTHEMSKVFLAQTLGSHGKDVNEVHYTSSGTDVGVGTTLFARLHQVQRKMYTELAPHLFAKQKAAQSHAA